MVAVHQRRLAIAPAVPLLAAEIGIVIASVALLLGNRAVWSIAVVLAVICLGKVGITYQHTQHAVAEAEKKIDAASKNVISAAQVKGRGVPPEKTRPKLAKSTASRPPSVS